MDFEGRREQVVQVDLVGFVDARNGNGASIALLAGAGGSALLFVLAVGLNGIAGLGGHVDHFCLLPVLERGVVRHEGCRPLVWVVNNISVRAVLEVFLLTGVKEQVKGGQVAERGEFRDRSAVLLMQ